MPKYIVLIPEVHYHSVEVEAPAVGEALDIARDGGGEDMGTEYSHVVDEDWVVRNKETGKTILLDPEE